jgi:phosphoheptose isomerase
VSDDNYNIDYLLGIASHVEDKGMEEDFLDAEHIRLAAELIERFRKERDEARRELLPFNSISADDAKAYAKNRGWDYLFKEDGK